MSEIVQIITNDIVKVNVTNSSNDSVSFEQKFPKRLTILELKGKLEIITGGCAGTMKLELYDGDKNIAKLNDNDCKLGAYPIEDGMRIHVIDNFEVFNDSTPKFELSDNEYSKKQNTVRDFLRRNNLGKYNEEERQKMAENALKEAEEMERLAALATVGSRCIVTAKGPRRIGTIMYNGQFQDKPGVFIGVKFDEPLGNHNGTVNGKKYFECQDKYGSIVPLAAVTVGDYPPEEFDLDEEI